MLTEIDPYAELDARADASEDGDDEDFRPRPRGKPRTVRATGCKTRMRRLQF